MSDSSTPNERRALPRQRTLLRGRICYGPKHVMSVDCNIRNLTARGAMLRAPANQALPGAFALILVSEGVAYDAKVTWRRGEILGVLFDGRHDLRAGDEEDLKSLRAIWAALAPA